MVPSYKEGSSTAHPSALGPHGRCCGLRVSPGFHWGGTLFGLNSKSNHFLYIWKLWSPLWPLPSDTQVVGLDLGSPGLLTGADNTACYCRSLGLRRSSRGLSPTNSHFGTKHQPFCS